MKAAALIRQRMAIKPSVPDAPVDGCRRGPRADSAECALLRRAAQRLVLTRRSR